MWHLAGITLALLAAAPLQAASGSPVVTYHGDRLTVRMEKVAVSDGIRAIETATGASVKGKIPSEGELTMTVEDVPLHEALGRIFGERNYAITYRKDGTPAVIELFGAPLPSSPKVAATPSPPQAIDDDAGWPRDDETRAAVATLQGFLDRNHSIDLGPDLAAVTGTKTTTFIDLMKVAAQNDSRRVRARAWRRAMRTMREDEAAWAALATVMQTAPQDGMRDFARQQLGPNAEELTRQLIRHAGPGMRTPARAVLDQLAVQPTTTGGVVATP